MDWIIKAAIVNTIWTLWCTQRVPARVVTRFGPNGQAAGWMSRRGFALFSLFFPIALAAFMVFIGGIAGQSAGAIGPAMNHLAAGLILFFSLITWCIVRSNRSSPERIDVLSLLISIVALMAFVFVFIQDVSKVTAPRHASNIPASSRN